MPSYAGLALKDGVKLHNITPQITVGIMAAVALYNAYGAKLTITSVNDSQHSRTSLHWAGNAVDLRSKNVSVTARDKIVAQLKEDLGPDFDIILEDAGGTNEHIHMEYQPKGG